MKRYLFTVLALILVVMPGCENKEEVKAEKQKELLIYCGITMIRPMSEIARIIEQEENCKIIITKGGSGNLLKSIRVNKVGDLYLPGSDSYINTCLDEGLLTETGFVGYNKAALMVQKGNPKQLSGDLDNLLRKDLYVVICNYETGSIGKETKKILDKKGIFEEVQKNASELTTDSKRLITLLKEKRADLVINWYATAVWPENSPYVDVIEIDEKYAGKKKLVLGILKTSEYPELAKKFLDYAISDKGHEIFKKFGLAD